MFNTSFQSVFLCDCSSFVFFFGFCWLWELLWYIMMIYYDAFYDIIIMIDAVGFGHFVIFFGPCTSSGSQDTNVPSQDDHAITINLPKKTGKRSSNLPTNINQLGWQLFCSWFHPGFIMFPWSQSPTAPHPRQGPGLTPFFRQPVGRFRQTPGMRRFGRKN